MKWYSVKKYKPAVKHALYLVRTNYAEIHIATLIGDEELEWISDDKEYFDDILITHFCVIEPVEIEE